MSDFRDIDSVLDKVFMEGFSRSEDESGAGLIYDMVSGQFKQLSIEDVRHITDIIWTTIETAEGYLLPNY